MCAYIDIAGVRLEGFESIHIQILDWISSPGFWPNHYNSDSDRDSRPSDWLALNCLVCAYIDVAGVELESLDDALHRAVGGGGLQVPPPVGVGRGDVLGWGGLRSGIGSGVGGKVVRGQGCGPWGGGLQVRSSGGADGDGWLQRKGHHLGGGLRV